MASSSARIYIYRILCAERYRDLWHCRNSARMRRSCTHFHRDNQINEVVYLKDLYLAGEFMSSSKRRVVDDVYGAVYAVTMRRDVCMYVVSLFRSGRRLQCGLCSSLTFRVATEYIHILYSYVIQLEHVANTSIVCSAALGRRARSPPVVVFSAAPAKHLHVVGDVFRSEIPNFNIHNIPQNISDVNAKNICVLRSIICCHTIFGGHKKSRANRVHVKDTRINFRGQFG